MTIKKVIILACIATFGLLHFASCKKDCPPNDMAYLDNDTAVVPYTALETLKFIVKDSLGNFMDSVTYIGKGKKKFIGDADYPTGSGYEECITGTDMQAMDYPYQDAKNPGNTLVFTITHNYYDSKFETVLKTQHTPSNYINMQLDHNRYIGNTSDFNPRKPRFHDSITIQGKTYYNVVQFQSYIHIVPKYINLYFGKNDGLISLDETPNRKWYKIN